MKSLSSCYHRVVNYIKKVDGSDVYDENISYNVLKNQRTINHE